MPTIDVRERHVSWRRLLAGGIVATALLAMGGGALELWWFGASNAAAARRADREIHRRFDAMVRAVTQVSELVGGNPAAVESLSASTDDARPLFDLVREARRSSEAADQIAVTIYDQAIVARAWAGAPSDIPNERISAAATLSKSSFRGSPMITVNESAVKATRTRSGSNATCIPRVVMRARRWAAG